MSNGDAQLYEKMKEGPSGSVIRNDLKPPRAAAAKVVAVSVAETPGHDPVRHGLERRA